MSHSSRLGVASVGHAARCTVEALLAYKTQTTDQHDEEFGAENDAQGDHRADHTSYGLADAATSVAVGGGAGDRGVGAVAAAQGAGAAHARRVAACSAPVSLRLDAELAHRVGELGPGDRAASRTEQRKLDRLGGRGCRPVVEVEAHRDVVGAGEVAAADGRVGDQLPSQGGGVIGHAEEVRARDCEIGETEEGQHSCVGAELNVHLVLALSSDGAVEGVNDLGGDDGARHGADGLGFVVRKPPLVLVGQGAKLEEGLIREELGVWEVAARIVDRGHVQQIEDGVGVLEASLRRSEGPVDHWGHAVVKVLRAVESMLVLGTLEVVVGADLRVGAVRRTLQPSRVLTVCSIGDGLQGDELIPVQWTLDHSAIPQSIRPQLLANRGIEALEEAEGRVLQDSVDRGRGCDLRLLHQVTVQPEDPTASVTGHITIAEECTARKHLLVSQVGQIRGGSGFGSPVSVTREDVQADHGLSGGRRGQRGQKRQ